MSEKKLFVTLALVLAFAFICGCGANGCGDSTGPTAASDITGSLPVSTESESDATAASDEPNTTGESAAVESQTAATDDHSAVEFTLPADFFDDFVPAKYTITFDSRGGSAVEKIEEVSAVPRKLPVSTRSGYAFKGWYADIDCRKPIVCGGIPTSDLTLYAGWEKEVSPAPVTYTVTFNSNGGSAVEAQTNVEYILNFEESIRSGYQFEGWFYEADFKTEAQVGDKLTKDITLFAKWKEIKEPVTEPPATIGIDDDGVIHLPPVTFSPRHS